MSWLPDWITGYDAANAERAAQADKILQEQNAQIYADNPDAAATAAKDYGSQGEISPDAQRAQIDQAFNQGLKDSYTSTKQGIAGFFSGAFGLVPWKVWLIGAAILFVYVGGLEKVRKALA